LFMSYCYGEGNFFKPIKPDGCPFSVAIERAKFDEELKSTSLYERAFGLRDKDLNILMANAHARIELKKSEENRLNKNDPDYKRLLRAIRTQRYTYERQLERLKEQKKLKRDGKKDYDLMINLLEGKIAFDIVFEEHTSLYKNYLNYDFIKEEQGEMTKFLTNLFKGKVETEINKSFKASSIKEIVGDSIIVLLKSDVLKDSQLIFTKEYRKKEELNMKHTCESILGKNYTGISLEQIRNLRKPLYGSDITEFLGQNSVWTSTIEIEEVEVACGGGFYSSIFWESDCIESYNKRAAYQLDDRGYGWKLYSDRTDWRYVSQKAYGICICNKQDCSF
jgi:hypothetical protein